jgi:AraC-like DNA-binding protein
MATRNFALSERQYNSYSGGQVHAHVKNYIIITIAGKYQSSFDTRIEEFTPWMVSYHQAGISHASRYSAHGARVLYVEIPAEQLANLPQTAASHLRHFSVKGGLIEWTARQLYNEFNSSDPFSRILIDGMVTQLLAYLLRQRREVPHGLATWLGKADEIIRSRFTEPLALAEIANAVHVHPGHLAREYVRHYRCTVGEQIRRLRVELACEQLSSTDRCLADIALGSGFSDQSHFTVSFKQQIGTTPSQYRKNIKTTLLS